MEPMRKKLHIFLSLLGGWMLLLLSIGTAHAQLEPFKVSGKLCIPDQECLADSTVFTDTLATSTAWSWDFGDGSGLITSTKNSIKHLFQTPGMKLITLTRTVAGIPETVTRTVNVGVPPPAFPNWRRDTMICKEDLGKLFLNPYPNNAPNGVKYMWFPKGDTTQTLRVDSSGCYSVEVTNADGCTYEDKITVKVCLEQSNQEGAKWYFGNNAGLDFSGGSPQPLTDGQIKTPEGTSSISNSKGQLLFYTDGVKIFDKNGVVMPSKDTAALAGSPNSTQSALIVPKPTCRGCEYLYYVFTTSEINGQKKFSYSLVDMRRNGGNGEVVETNNLLNDNTTERIASVRNERDSTYWIVSHDYDSNVFRVYHATKAGLEGPFQYALGAVQDTVSKGEGYMKFSPADSTGMRRLAVVVPGPPRNLVEIYNFSDSSGRLSGPQTIDLGPAPPKAYGVEFSPDGTKMYVSLQKGDAAGDTTLSRLWQYDISLGDSARIADSKILIDSSATQVYGALQVGSDGRIYLAIKDSQYLGVINEPDEDSQDEVRFVKDGIFLGGSTSQLGLPNFVQNFTNESSGPGFTYSDTCSNQATNFQASPLCDPIKDSYTWNFGDGSAPVTGQNQQVQHTYKMPGTYSVSLRLVNRCKDTTITQRITIIATPDPINLKSPIDTCTNRLVLDAGVEAEAYFWRRNRVPLAQTKTITLQPNGGSGSYEVFAANGIESQCFSRGATQVTLRRPPAYSLGPDTSLCVGGGNVVLNAKPTPTNWNKFQWSTGETTQLITVTQPGTYFVQVTINTGTPQACVNEDTIQVRALPKAKIAAVLTPPTGCTTTDGQIVIGNISPPSGSYTFEWFGPNNTMLSATGNTLPNVGEGTYRVMLRGNPAVCATDSSFGLRAVRTLRLQPTIVNARCTLPSSGAINLNTLAGTPQTYVWTNAMGAGLGTNAALLANLLPGMYNVKVTDAGGCDTTLRDITVGITPDKFLSLGPDRKKCIGDTALLIPSLPLIPGNQYRWSTGETTDRISVTRGGTYTLTVTNTVTGCTDNDDFTYSLAPRPTYDLTKEVPLCDLDDGAMATLAVRGGASNLSYFWFHSEERTSRVMVSLVGNYRVRISNPEGCELFDTARVVVRCEPRIYIPDVFTPNGDGNNDVLNVFGDHLTDFELKIFNRWGEVIFYTNDINQKWDGSYRGSVYPPMSYPYVVSFKSKFFPDRPRENQRGAVLLVR
ncbi:PKD domain-containing protein [Runella aurantiaca]|uniref:PKD domain-containing protein n=2 Tax=Runella aurantiaca TaxID=2282308 RepID=A0A369IFE8_9BACT|nr:PKD domain-containing protein [Runella aurantiaca]